MPTVELVAALIHAFVLPLGMRILWPVKDLILDSVPHPATLKLSHVLDLIRGTAPQLVMPTPKPVAELILISARVRAMQIHWLVKGQGRAFAPPRRGIKIQGHVVTHIFVRAARVQYNAV